MNLSVRKKWLIFEGLKKNDKEEPTLGYPSYIVLIANIIYIIILFFSAMYSVELKGYYPLIFGIFVGYILSRIFFIVLVNPRNIDNKKASITLLLILTVIFFVIILYVLK